MLKSGAVFKVSAKLAVSVLMLVACSASAELNESLEQEFTVSQGSQFILDNVNGKVVIEAWQQSSIKVIAEKFAETEQAMANMEVNMTQRGDTVMVKTDYKESSWRKRGGNSKVNYQVFLPAEVKFTEIDLVNGSLTVTKVRGDVDADLVNGTIKAYDLVGNGHFDSVNGSIYVSYQGVDNIKKIHANTVNGSIKLKLPADISATVSAETNHGSINNDFGLAASKGFFSGKELIGTIGKGDVTIDLESVNGSISILNN